MKVFKLFRVMLIMLMVIMSINIFLAGSLDKVELGLKIVLSFTLMLTASIVGDKKAYIAITLIMVYLLVGIIKNNWLN